MDELHVAANIHFHTGLHVARDSSDHILIIHVNLPEYEVRTPMSDSYSIMDHYIYLIFVVTTLRVAEGKVL